MAKQLQELCSRSTAECFQTEVVPNVPQLCKNWPSFAADTTEQLEGALKKNLTCSCRTWEHVLGFVPWLCNRKGLRAATELPNYALGLSTDSDFAWSCEDFQTLRHAAWKQWHASLARNGDTASIHAAPTHCSAYCVVLGGPAAAWPEV